MTSGIPKAPRFNWIKHDENNRTASIRGMHFLASRPKKGAPWVLQQVNQPNMRDMAIVKTLEYVDDARKLNYALERFLKMAHIYCPKCGETLLFPGGGRKTCRNKCKF